MDSHYVVALIIVGIAAYLGYGAHKRGELGEGDWYQYALGAFIVIGLIALVFGWRD